MTVTSRAHLREDGLTAVCFTGAIRSYAEAAESFPLQFLKGANKMKICHCIKLDDAERVALIMVIRMLKEMEDDNMICNEFRDSEYTEICDIRVYLESLTEFIDNFGK